IPSIIQCDLPAITFPFMHDVTAGALAPTRIEFRWELPLALLGLRARHGDAAALQALEADRQSTLLHLSSLSPMRGEGDPWAHVLRRLVALGEVYACVLGRPADGAALLQSAAGMGFEYHFAGFRAPACLTLAEGF